MNYSKIVICIHNSNISLFGNEIIHFIMILLGYIQTCVSTVVYKREDWAKWG